MDEKVCTECRYSKPLEKFARNSHGLYGRASRCKACVNFWRKDYYKTGRPQATLQAWRTSSRGRKSQMLASAKQRARDKGIEFSIGIDDFDIPEFCPILGTPLVMNVDSPGPDSASLDRIDVAFGYVPGNVQVISYRANRMKNDATPEELLEFADWVRKTFGDT
jgi:hypothetical protein